MLNTGIRSAAMLVALCVCPATAFEQDGFRSGMSVQEILDTARASGSQPVAGAANDPAFGFFFMNEFGINVSYCGGRLFAVNKSLSGGVDGFASTAKDMMAQYGQPKVQVSSQYAKDGLLSYVHLSWTTPEGEERNTGLTSFSGQISVTVGSSAHALLCK